MYQNPRVKTIQTEAINKANLPKNKYNFPLHQHVEELTGISSDRTSYDVGTEQELLNTN